MNDLSPGATHNGVAATLVQTWAQQGRDGFLLSDPQTAEIGTSEVFDPRCQMRFRFRWIPHREIRGDVAELERRGPIRSNCSRAPTSIRMTASNFCRYWSTSRARAASRCSATLTRA